MPLPPGPWPSSTASVGSYGVMRSPDAGVLIGGIIAPDDGGIICPLICGDMPPGIDGLIGADDIGAVIWPDIGVVDDGVESVLELSQAPSSNTPAVAAVAAASGNKAERRSERDM
ncbi:hypothetical protein [Gordonia effusa]|nr:hypothetical protein [Gordonia effusa]